jgi:hypothetical protein
MISNYFTDVVHVVCKAVISKMITVVDVTLLQSGKPQAFIQMILYMQASIIK